MLSHPTLLLALSWLLLSTAAAANPVQIDLRLRPDIDKTVEETTEVVTTVRVLEDKGIIAKSTGRLSTSPTTTQTVSRQKMRYVTGKANDDGSFGVEMSQLAKSTALRLPSGEETQLPENPLLQRLKVRATIEASGMLRADSVDVSGLEGPIKQMASETIASVIQQAASIDPITLTFDKPTPQTVNMQVPVFGIATLDAIMRTSYQLLSVTDGVATVQKIYSMDFSIPFGPMKIRADGGGDGTLTYDMTTKAATSDESTSWVTIVAEHPDGVLEFRRNIKQSERTMVTRAQVTAQ